MNLSYHFINCNRLFRAVWVLSGAWLFLSILVSVQTYLAHGYTLSSGSILIPAFVFCVFSFAKINLLIGKSTYKVVFSIFTLKYTYLSSIFSNKVPLQYTNIKDENLYSLVSIDDNGNRVRLINRIPRKNLNETILNLDLNHI